MVRKLPVAPLPMPSVADRIATALHKLGLAMKHQTWVLAAADGVSPTQGQILATLAADGPLSGTELGTRLGIKLPTISESVRALTDKHLVEKRPDPRHPRASLVALTATGRSRAAKARSWPEFLATAVGAMDAAEQATFFTGLLKMIRALQEAGQIPTSAMCMTCTYFRPDVRTGEQPHHCALVDAPLAPSELRLDCPDHVGMT